MHAAEGYARSTGKIGVVLVTSGPGATNAVTGLTDALMDSIPIVCNRSGSNTLNWHRCVQRLIQQELPEYVQSIII